MKIYISADMEGITGVTHWDEVDHDKTVYIQFQKQMSLEVAAACEGALEAGAKEIWVKDAHYTGRNIISKMLPKAVKLIRGWSGHPYCMVQELDDSFDALVMIGYHSRAGQGGNPLAHTLSSSKIDSIHINGQQTSEFFLHGNIAAKHHVPIVFLSGDVGLCEEVLKVSPVTTTVATMVGVGDSTISIQPQESIDNIKSKVKSSLSRKFSDCLWNHPKSFDVQIRFNSHQKAYRASHYPGVKLIEPKTIKFHSEDYDDVMKMILFVV
ncbi:MAG: amino acid amidase [Candidatus Marinimicrobia bacterium]|nr:amino acid amidase [Candidatus Neomarinimicrobiota bacterium]